MGIQRTLSARERFRNQVRYFNRQVFNPFALSFAGRPVSFWSVIVHTGRRSGQERITPIVAARQNDSFVILLPYGQQVDWLKNVMTAGRAELIYRGSVYRISQPKIIKLEEGLEALPGVIQTFMRKAGMDALLYFNQCALADDSPGRYASLVAAYPIERGVWILAAIAALLLGIVRRLRHPTKKRR